MRAKSLEIWAKFLKIRAKMAPNGVWFREMTPKRLQKNIWRPFFGGHTKRSSWSLKEEICSQKSHKNFCRASWGKLGQKSLAPPKMCLLLHLCSVEPFSDKTYKHNDTSLTSRKFETFGHDTYSYTIHSTCNSLHLINKQPRSMHPEFTRHQSRHHALTRHWWETKNMLFLRI